MRALRQGTPWIAGAAWGAVSSILALSAPFVGIPTLTVSAAVTIAIAVVRRRTEALSGLLVGLGGPWSLFWALGELACRGAAFCERSAAGAVIGLAGLVLLVGGVLLIGRRG